MWSEKYDTDFFMQRLSVTIRSRDLAWSSHRQCFDCLASIQWVTYVCSRLVEQRMCLSRYYDIVILSTELLRSIDHHTRSGMKSSTCILPLAYFRLHLFMFARLDKWASLIFRLSNSINYHSSYYWAYLCCSHDLWQLWARLALIYRTFLERRFSI
jgi:hypothetical protein